MENPFIDVTGWIGSLLLIIAYLLVSRKGIRPDSFAYQGLNIAGSVLLIVNTWFYGAFPSATLNIIWVGIGFFYLAKHSKKWKTNS